MSENSMSQRAEEEVGGRHRGAAAPTEESENAAPHGRHRRPEDS